MDTYDVSLDAGAGPLPAESVLVLWAVLLAASDVDSFFLSSDAADCAASASDVVGGSTSIATGVESDEVGGVVSKAKRSGVTFSDVSTVSVSATLVLVPAPDQKVIFRF